MAETIDGLTRLLQIAENGIALEEDLWPIRSAEASVALVSKS